MFASTSIRRYGAWLADHAKSVRWCLTRLLAALGLLIAIAAFAVFLVLPNVEISPAAIPAGDSFHPWLLVLAFVAGAAGFITGVVGNIAADQCLKWYERRTPAVSDFFGNHQLTRLVGQSLGMVIRSFAGNLNDIGERNEVQRIAKEVETNWETAVQSPSAQRRFTSLMEGGLVAYVRDPQQPPLPQGEWLGLLQLLTPERRPPNLPAARLNALSRMLSDRFGFALRMALKRDFALRGEASMGMWLDISRELLQQSGSKVFLDDETKQALGEAQHSLTAAADLLTLRMDRYTRAVLADVESLRHWLSDRFDRLENKIDELRRIVEQDIESRRQPGGPPDEPVDPEVLDAARELKRLGDLRDQARAAIVERDFTGVDDIIGELRAKRETEEFDLLTLEGDRWYFAGEFDRAIDPYERALILRPDKSSALNNAATAHGQARLGSIAAHQHRAIELLEHAAGLTEEVDPVDWATTQHNLGNAWQSADGRPSREPAAGDCGLRAGLAGSHPRRAPRRLGDDAEQSSHCAR